MSRDGRALPLVLLVLLCLMPLLAGGPTASADAWTDARKEFRKAQRAADWHTRRDAYLRLLSYDGKDAVEEILHALAKEKNPAVVLGAIQTLTTFLSPEALAALDENVRKGRGDRQLYALIALADRPDAAGTDVLLETLGGKDEPLAAQAALALGRKQVKKALPRLVALLSSPTWQLRSAGARALALMAGPSVTDPQTLKVSWPPPPAWMDVPKLLPPLVESLRTAVGRARGDLVDALERLTGQSWGYDIDAWAKLASGADPKTITPHAVPVPSIFGIPIYGERVVLVVDSSTCTDDAHPFQDRKRLKELCEVPHARPIPWFKIRTTKAFFAAHGKRLIQDLPAGTKFDVLAVSQKVDALFSRLMPVNAGTQEQGIRFFDKLEVHGGPNHYEGLMAALDIAGAKESVAWAVGPDEIVFMTCAIPWAPNDPNAIVNQEEVGAAVGLKARLRMVPIHTVGVGPHPFTMMRLISEQSGGRYLDLSK